MTRKVVLSDEEADIVYELVLRGLHNSDPTEPRYGEAFDAFVEGAGYPRRIGDQPENVRDVWAEVFVKPRCGDS